ncbi:MAG: hypothetical protein PHF56_15070 [Desulfuromonadaceae bacterium]|nr:hypothetical protein [Desulfuromonadaceae bacterium]
MLPYDLKNYSARISFGILLAKMVDTLCFLLTAVLITMIFAAMLFSFILAATVPIPESFQQAFTMEVQK